MLRIVYKVEQDVSVRQCRIGYVGHRIGLGIHAERGGIDNQVVLRLEEKGLLITIVDKEFDISSLHELKDELGDTYNNIVQCICASGSLVRYRVLVWL